MLEKGNADAGHERAGPCGLSRGAIQKARKGSRLVIFAVAPTDAAASNARWRAGVRKMVNLK